MPKTHSVRGYRKPDRLNIQMFTEDKHLLWAQADELRMTVSDFIRFSLVKAGALPSHDELRAMAKQKQQSSLNS